MYSNGSARFDPNDPLARTRWCSEAEPLDGVNLAARLEGLNKEYGTTILVSEAVRNRVDNCFRFNSVASVIAKGMTTESRVYELVEAVA